ncbi:hypothetical protein IQ244_16225 [Nostoc sp. LEGE 06077]|uniref:hypothetical protein n=1 Tax=Nostoc sp. LEGE 06077 TaxID=915325 RepID=UPI0018827411|nr:hypothetical protein [Nostoc sp. LEGE 06077]MBE9208042.1 hypothetical protein [Nostoc sp. LEGE 06077]
MIFQQGDRPKISGVEKSEVRSLSPIPHKLLTSLLSTLNKMVQSTSMLGVPEIPG